MLATIQFLDNLAETTIPFIFLTRAITGVAGTATFIFIEPTIISLTLNDDYFSLNLPIRKMVLSFENQNIETKDIEIFFFKGKPLIIKSIFIFKNNFEWFNFLNFMKIYSAQTGLYFSSEINNFL